MGKGNGNKMKASSVQSKECTTADNSSIDENSVLSDTLTVDDSDPRFQIPADTVLLYPNRKDRLFKITVKSHKNNRNKISYSSWGPQLDEWVCARSIWAYAQFSSLLSNTRKIPRDIAARIDEMDLTGEIKTSLRSTEVSPDASNINPIGLPDLETI